MAQTLPTTYAQTLTFNAYVPQNPGLNAFTPAVVGTQAVTAAAIDLHQGTPYSPQWSFNIQRSLGSQTLCGRSAIWERRESTWSRTCR